MEIINNSNFKESIAKGVVLVDFSATWCGPCKMLSPVLEQVEKEVEAKIYKVDIDESEDLAKEFAVMVVPTLIVFKDGKQVQKLTGFMPKDQIVETLASV